MSVCKWSFWISPLVALFVFVDVAGTGGALAASVVMGDWLRSTNTTSVPAVTTDAAASSMEIGSNSNTEIGSISTTETESVSTFETASTSIIETESISTFETASTSTFEARNTTETESANTFETGSTSTFGKGSMNTFETETTSTFEMGSTSTFETGSTSTFDIGSTSTFETRNTFETRSTSTFETGSTSGTGSTSTFETGSTSGTGSTSTFETGSTSGTGSTSTFETGSTTGTESTSTFKTESTTGTGSTNTFETGSMNTLETETTSTYETGSTRTFETESTSTFETRNTFETEAISTFETGSTTGTESTSTFETGSTTGTGSTSIFETGSSSLGVTEPCQQQQLCSAGDCLPGCSSPSYSVQTSPATRDTGSGSTARNILLHFVTTVTYRGALSARLAQPLSKGSDAGETSTMVSTLAPPSTQTHLVTSRNTSRGETSDVFMRSIMDTLREFNSVVQTTGGQSPLGGTGQSTGPAEHWEGIAARTSTETIAESTQGMTPPTNLYSEPTRTAESTLPTGQSSLTSAWPTKTTENSTPAETSSWVREEPTQTFSEPTRTTSGFKGEEYTPIFSEPRKSTGDPNQIWVDTASRSSPVLYSTTQYNYWEEIMGERAVFDDSTPSYTGPGLVPHDNNSQGFFDFGLLLPEADSSSLPQTTFPSTTKKLTSVDAQAVSDSTTTTAFYLSTTSGELGYVSTSHVAVLPDEREAHDIVDRKSSSIGPEKLPEDAIIAGVRSTSGPTHGPQDVRSTSPAPGLVAAPTTHTSNVNDIHVKTEKGLNSEDPETIAKNYLPPLPEDEATPHVGQHQQESQYLQILLVAAPSAVAFLSLLGLTCLTCCMCKHRYRRWMAVRKAKRRMQKEQKKAKKKKQNGTAHVENETRHGNRETVGKKHSRRHRPQDNDLTHKQTANGRPHQSAVAAETTQAKPSKLSPDHAVIRKQHPLLDKN